jgi:hypothetical protein
MAGLGRKEWSPGDTLTAADVNGYLMDQSVMVFAGTAARASAIPTPSAGMVAYSTATGLEVYNGSSFTAITKVLQVVQATFGTATTTTSTSYVTTGLNATITPSSTTSKILVMVTVPARNANSNGAGYFTIFRGTVAGTNLLGSFGFSGVYSSGLTRCTVASNYLDSPATISAQTYTVGMKAESASSAIIAQEDSMTSTMTLLEISA